MLQPDYFALDTIYGEKIIEFRHGDITEIEEEVDILVSSAFAGDYYPSSTSLIGALFRKFSLSVEDLSRQPALDLRRNLNTWVSSEVREILKTNNIYFKRLIVVEDFRINKLRETFNNIFATVAVAELKGMGIRTIIMPLLGSGDQAISYELILRCIIDEAKKAMKTIAGLERIIFCEISEHKARRMFEELDKVLKRAALEFTEEQRRVTIQPIFEDLKTVMFRLSKHSDSAPHVQAIINGWHDSLAVTGFEPKTFAHFCRTFMENFLYHHGWKKKYKGDAGKIIVTLVEDHNFAPWVASYLHILRVTANHYLHVEKKYLPPEIQFKDILIALISLLRIVEFWAQILEKKK